MPRKDKGVFKLGFKAKDGEELYSCGVWVCVRFYRRLCEPWQFGKSLPSRISRRRF